MRTQVGIIGAGPAGLLLSHLLALRGIDSVVVENRSRDYVEARVRAGVLEQSTVDVLTDAGLGDRLHRDGRRHDGIYLQTPAGREHLDFRDLCGRSVWVYGQTEVVRDLIAARMAAAHPIYFGVSATDVHDVDSDHPRVTFVDADGRPREVECEVIAGCDGFHGVTRERLPASTQKTWTRSYPYAWLGILATVAPSTDELIYAWHPNGFALHSMRSSQVSRLYLQVDPAEEITAWSDDRIWNELQTRLGVDGWQLQTGPITDRSITQMRSLVSAPMRHGRLFLAGDAAHIVPPTGAKGLNLAVSDVVLLCDALTALVGEGRSEPADAYSGRALQRVWRATHFSWWMTSMLHRSGDDFDAQLQLSQLACVTSSRSAAQSLAENYTGMPIR